ncbi:MAG: NAD(P)H-hydrate dehydratase [Clostridium sp.]|nr:NAD(P)H-hydrate dehydratase [Clostridium sp.]
MESKNLITKETALNLLPQRPSDANKGTFGKVLNIAGCLDYQGAAYLSSATPLKVGAGLVTLATTENVINNLASNAPWITFYKLRDYQNKYIASDAFTELKNIITGYTVVSIGPGLSTEPAVMAFVDEFIKYINKTETKVVIDADALNIIAKLEIQKLPQESVITPHPKELSRLLNIPVEEIQKDRIKYAKQSSEKFGCTTVLKGSGTVICTPDFEIFINTSGNSAMSKAGSGDVLTGIISGLISQGLSIKEASLLGVYLHGLCGDLAKIDLSEYCVMATDLIDYIPKAIKFIKGE